MLRWIQFSVRPGALRRTRSQSDVQNAMRNRLKFEIHYLFKFLKYRARFRKLMDMTFQAENQADYW